MAGDAKEGLAPAPLRLRFAAFVYDALIVLGIWIATIVALVTAVGDAVVGAWVQSLLFAQMYAFFAFFWCRRGQTAGMLAWRLKLRTDSGRLLPRQALLRFIGDLASFATLGLGFCRCWFAADKRTLADALSNSDMVRMPKGRGRSA